jgi:hypothetical protein
MTKRTTLAVIVAYTAIVSAFPEPDSGQLKVARRSYDYRRGSMSQADSQMKKPDGPCGA